MEYSTSYINVNSIFRELLIITSPTAIDFKEANVITQKISDEMDIVYYTDGLYQHIPENGSNYYWFLINSKETKTRATYKAEVVALQTQVSDVENAIAQLAYGGIV